MFHAKTQRKLTVFVPIIIAAVITLDLSAPVFAAVVTPKIGGAQVGGMELMIMPEITIDPVTKAVVVKDTAGNVWVTMEEKDWPVLRPLAQNDSFDPAKVWYNALNGMAYNWQYGWDSAAFNPALLPTGGKIWLEVTDQSKELKTYDRNNSYAQIFPNSENSNKWKWTQSMAHNAYTVTPGIGKWFATYTVYVGDETTGEPIDGFGSAAVTLNWTSIPEPATLALMMIGVLYLLPKKRK